MGSVNTILQANNVTRVDKAKYDAAVMQQRASNKAEAAKTSLAEFSRSLGNILRIEAAGKQYNDATSQLASVIESRGLTRANASLAAADRMGALTAQAAALGVGGSSVDLLNDTIKLQRNVEQELQQMATDRLASSGARANAQVMDNAFNTIDLTRSFGTFDHTVYIEPKRMKRRLGKLIGVAVATFFGGPMAGEAVADMAVASWQASNANFGGASQSLDSAIQNGTQAWLNRRGTGQPENSMMQKQKDDWMKGDKSKNMLGAKSEDTANYGLGFGADWFKGG